MIDVEPFLAFWQCVTVNNAVEDSEEQFSTSSASKQASCVSIAADRVCHCAGWIYFSSSILTTLCRSSNYKCRLVPWFRVDNECWHLVNVNYVAFRRFGEARCLHYYRKDEGGLILQILTAIYQTVLCHIPKDWKIKFNIHRSVHR